MAIQEGLSETSIQFRALSKKVELHDFANDCNYNIEVLSGDELHGILSVHGYSGQV